MRTWEQYIRNQEDNAFGQFLVASIAKIYGCNETPEAINRAVYKNTACGAWCVFDEAGIEVGTIVEGSDAEHSERVDISNLDFDEESERILIDRFLTAVGNCEEFANEPLANH